MSTLRNDSLLRALRGEAVEQTPIWIMRQAGRVLPEYREVRQKHSFLDVAKNPDLCAEVTVQPVDHLGVDAAILFSDILLPFEAMGVGLDFQPGPILEKGYDPRDGIDSLRLPEPEQDYAFLGDCIRATLARLDDRVPLLGFAGAPFTLATYLLEGGSSKNYVNTRRYMNTAPQGFREFLFYLSDRIAEWLQIQIDAGVHAFQLFDSWAGILSPHAMEHFAIPAARRVFSTVKIPADMPTIYFAPGAASTLDAQQHVGSSVTGVDWRISIAEVRSRYPARPLQGNMDPGVVLGAPEEIERAIRDVLEGAGKSGGHVFNLGHGFLPETPVENAEFLVRRVHEISRETALA